MTRYAQKMKIEKRESNGDGGGRNDRSSKWFRREEGEDSSLDFVVHERGGKVRGFRGRDVGVVLPEIRANVLMENGEKRRTVQIGVVDELGDDGRDEGV